MFADDDEDEMLCPLCMEDLDLTDRCFHPCPCGYQICSFCWNRIMNEDSTSTPPRCPACRKPYEEENYVIDEPTEEQLTKMQQKKQRERQKKLESKESKEAQSRKHLANVRVIQRNLVYITNLPVHMAKEEILRRPDNFGQYGKILKVVINKNVYNVNSPAGPSVSVYITYSRKEDAMLVIQSVDNCLLDNRVLRASFGTTKYCTYFLRGVACTNPDCMYLHELGGEKDSYTKEDMAQGKHHFHDPAHPAQPIASGFGRPVIPRSQQLLALSGGVPKEETPDPEEKILRNSAGAVLPPAPTAPVWKVPAATETPALNPVEWPSAGAAASIKPKPAARSQPQVSILPPTASWGKGSLKTSTETLAIPDLPVPEKKPEPVEEKKQPQITILKHDDKAKKQKETEPKRSQTPQLPVTPPPTTSPSLPSPKNPLTIEIGNAPPILATWDEEEEVVPTPTPAPIPSKPPTSSVVAAIEHSVPVIPVEKEEELDFDPWKESAQGLEDYEEDYEPEVEELPQGARSRFGFAQNAWPEEEVKPKSPEAPVPTHPAVPQPIQSEDLQQSFRKLLPDININFSVQQPQSPQPPAPVATAGSWSQPTYFNTWMQFPPGIPTQYPPAVSQDQIWRKPNQPIRTTPPPGLPIPKTTSKSPGSENSGFVDSAIIGAGVAIKTLEEASWGLPSATPYHPFPSVTSPPPGLGHRVQIFPETQAQVNQGQQHLPKNATLPKPPSPAPITPPPAPSAETESKKQRKQRNKQAQQAKPAPVASQVKQKGSNGSTKSKEVKNKLDVQPEPIIESNDSAEQVEEAPQEVPPEKTMTDEEKKRERALRKKQRKEQEKLEKQKREQEQRERKKQQEREKQERLREQKEKEQREREQREREQRELKEQREREQRELREQREREQREREQREKEAAEKAANKQKKKQQRAQQQAQNNHASNHQNLSVPQTQSQQLSPRRGQNSQTQHQNNSHHTNQNGTHKANDKSHHPTPQQNNHNIQSFHSSNLDRTSLSLDSASRLGGSHLLDNLNTNTSVLDATTQEVESLEKQVEIAKQEVKALADRLMELRQKTKLGGDH